MLDRVLSTPRPVPPKLLPALGASLVLVLALPIFVVAGWSLAGWALGPLLWVGVRAIGLLLDRVKGAGENIAASGLLAFGMMFKALAVLIVLIAVAEFDPHTAVAAASSSGSPTPLELGALAVTYFGSAGEMKPRRLVSLAIVLALAAPAGGLRAGSVPSRGRVHLDHWMPIHLGPLDLSINKAVVYLLLGALSSRSARDRADARPPKPNPGRRQTIGESIYEIAQTQVAEQGLPTKAIGRWFPYVASLMLFIWVVNLLGFIPLPLSTRSSTSAGVALSDLRHLRGDLARSRSRSRSR